MAVKVSRILQAGLAVGGLAALDDEAGQRIDGREDEQYRRAALEDRT
jgi:hypothetical protein